MIKIYKPTYNKLNNESKDLITKLLENRLPINHKLNNNKLYSKIKQTLNAENELIEKLIQP